MAPTLGEPDSPEICPTTTYFKLFRRRPTCDHLVAHQPQPQSQHFPGICNPPSESLFKGLLCKPDLDYRLMLLRAPDTGAPRGCHVAPFPRLYSRRYSKLRPSSGLWALWALRGGFSECPLTVSEEGFARVLWGYLRRVFRGSLEGVWGRFSEGPRGTDGIRGWRVSDASRPSPRASKLPVEQLVFVARGAFPRSTPCVCALRGFLPGRVSPTGLPGATVWLALPPTGWRGLSVLSHLVELQERKATQPSSGWWRCANPPRGEPSWSCSPWCLALRAAPRNARFGWVRPGRWPMGGGMETPLVSRCLVPGRMRWPPPEADRRLTIATQPPAPRMWVPAGSGLCSSPSPRASIRLGLAPRQALPWVVLTPRRSCRVLALISA